MQNHEYQSSLTPLIPPIRLPRVDSLLAEGDTGATLKTELIGLPKGAILSDGNNRVAIKSHNTALDLSGWNLDKLTLTPPEGFDGEIKLQVKASATELKNGSTAAATRELAVRVLEGNACATPVGVNPYVSYLNRSAVTGIPKPTLQASPLRPENRSCGIYLPSVSSLGHEEPEDSDEAMANWMKGLEHSLSSAFMEEMEKLKRESRLE